jgi:hypothetical protein
MLAETNRQDPVYLVTPAIVTDSYGDPQNDWEHAVETLIPGADLQRHMTQDKDEANSSTTHRTGTLIATGPRVDIYRQVNEGSRIRQGSEVWRVNGTPNVKIGRLFGNTHLTASLTRTTVEAPNG